MLTVSTMSGAWSVLDVVAVGGSAFGLVHENWSWIVSLPVTGSSQDTVYDGSIWSGPQDSRGDRGCVHYQINGSLIDHGEKFSKTIVDPTGPGYVGPPIRIEKFTFPYWRWSTFSAAGIITLGLQPWFQPFPDHSYNDTLFKGVYLRGEVDGNKIRIVYHYEEKSSSTAPWVVWHQVTPWYEVDVVAQKTRPLPSTTWTSFLPLTKTQIIPSRNFGTLSPSDWGRILARLKRIHPVYTNRDVFGDLCRRCANDAQTLDMNNIEYLAELPEIVSGLKEVLSLLRGKATLKSASKLYLSYKYGIRLTVADTIAIFQTLPRHLKKTRHHFRWVRSTESTTSQSCVSWAWRRSDSYHYKIYYSPYDAGLVNLVDQMWNVGLFPSLKNGWDLIPLSFVVDWFVDVSSRLSAYDAATFWSCNKVLGAIGSQRTVFEGVQGDVIFSSLSNSAGVATVTEYTRFVTDTVVTPLFFEDTPRDFTNYAEATSLLIARSKRL